ncbi:unnamed protein product, partial [Ectocarpus sp. 12 AP-2014]
MEAKRVHGVRGASVSVGQAWAQPDIASRAKKIGAHWLGLPNFCIHTCRTFWAT